MAATVHQLASLDGALRARGLAALACAILLAGCASGTPGETSDPDDLLIVDCRLPPRIRTLGRNATYLEARRAVRTSAVDCRIRGGEYVSHDRADYATALAVWLPLARSGDAEAQNYVGEIFQRGLGREPDYTVAAHWFRLAADQGHAAAQVNLGQLYQRGLGVERDPATATAWFRRASGLEAAGVEFVPVAPPENADEEALTARLEAARIQAEALREERDALSASLSTLRNDDARQKAELSARLAARERELSELGARAATLATRVAELEAQREQAAAERERAERKAAALPVAGPSIQIIDPPLRTQRGIELVSVDAAESTRVVVGRVDAAAGLFSLTVNGRPAEADAGGLFRAELKVPDTALDVVVVAVDRQGKSAERSFQLAPPERVAEAPAAEPEERLPGFGDYYALVIGNDDYSFLPDLDTAGHDAEAVASVLRDRYGFTVTLLRDATRYQILSALNRLRADLDEGDNLVIYYAGHGELDSVNMRGHWLPTDAERDSTANWISNVAITDILNAMSARHVMVVADSCYSGTLTRSALARLEAGMTDEAREAWIRAMLEKRSRTALTSGGLEPVLDAGGGDHSIFARVFLEVLERNDSVLEGQQLFQEVSARVTWAAQETRYDQVPQYAPIQYAGHESGDFFLVPRTP